MYLERLFALLRAWWDALFRAPVTGQIRPDSVPRQSTVPTAAAPSSRLKPLTPDELRAKFGREATPAPPPTPPKPAPPVYAEPRTRSVEAIFDEVGGKLGIDPNLLRAIATVESSYGRRLHSRGSPSYGWMQVNCGSNAGPDDLCTRRLPAGFMREWPVTPRRLLEDAEYNIELGARILRDELRQSRGDVVRAIAGYNIGGPNVPKTGPIPETFGAERPRAYVVKVLTEWRRRGGPNLLEGL